ncbi:hypothetical protein N7449_004358 [Penicillium cf. viridicatum]|uniref:Uncharacterized protein n=1 Tax=Penicillium cf. viridicatum TaxID=2972119 RepID=A0A9W9SXW3_9EURO|nr:hypothetical protein N7449_009298 [Penicillium cf. viridicatum]KAJ5202279.1 hypothetical protein N7449_004358 [Penicillium cf. viridicatum]
MPEMESRPVLPKMIGEKITTRCPNPDSALYPRRDWVVIEKLSERPSPVTVEDFDVGMGPAFTAGKYLCRLAGAGNENKLAFMRIYKQIPLVDTELDSSSVRKAQASNLHDHGHVELDALKHLTESGCTATPRLLGYRIGKQDANDLVPGGYIMHLVWEKVPGDPLDIDEFWSLPYNKREFIRDKFKKAYTEVLKFGYEPTRPSPSKIILDKTTGNIKISGFSWAARIDPDPRWEDYNFALFFLVLIDTTRDKFHPIMAEDIKHAESNGWRW